MYAQLLSNCDPTDGSLPFECQSKVTTRTLSRLDSPEANEVQQDFTKAVPLSRW